MPNVLDIITQPILNRNSQIWLEYGGPAKEELHSATPGEEDRTCALNDSTYVLLRQPILGSRLIYPSLIVLIGFFKRRPFRGSGSVPARSMPE